MENDYQLIILDVNMPATDATTLVKNILNIKPDARILVFSMNAEELYARRYMQLGARGYISKTAPLKELSDAIQTVLNNDRYVGTSLTQQLREESMSTMATVNPFNKLSGRELDIVYHLLNGSSTGAISDALKIKPSTVSTFKNRILQKLCCKNVVAVSQMARLYEIV